MEASWWAVSLSCCFVGGCGSSDDPNANVLPECSGANATSSECLTDYYFHHYDSDSWPACDSARPIPQIQKRLDAVLYVGEGITNSQAAVHTRTLQRYFEPYGLTLHTDAAPVYDPATYAMRGSVEEFGAALSSAGIDPSATTLSAEQQALALQVEIEIMYGPTRSFLERRAQPPEKKVNIVVISRVMDPALAKILKVQMLRFRPNGTRGFILDGTGRA